MTGGNGWVRALPATWGIDWRRVALVALFTVNLVLLGVVLAAFLRADVGSDWLVYRAAAHRLGNLYDVPSPLAFRYSPLLAYLFVVVTPLGYWAWAVAHLAALLALPRRCALIALVSFPFWADVYNGDTLTFVFVAAVLALRGSRWGTVAFVLMAFLMPRPLMLPLLAWIVWKRAEWRVPVLALGLSVLVGSLATGAGIDWLRSLARIGGVELGGGVDLGPALLLGVWWVPIGAALAVWFTAKGRLGLASLAASPYWLGYYLLMGLLELQPMMVHLPDDLRVEARVRGGGSRRGQRHHQHPIGGRCLDDGGGAAAAGGCPCACPGSAAAAVPRCGETLRTHGRSAQVGVRHRGDPAPGGVAAAAEQQHDERVGHGGRQRRQRGAGGGRVGHVASHRVPRVAGVHAAPEGDDACVHMVTVRRDGRRGHRR